MNSIKNGLASAWIAMASRTARVFAVDAASMVFAVFLGYAIRLSIDVGQYFHAGLAISCVVFPLCVGTSLLVTGTYKIYWPQAGVAELARLARAYSYGCAVFLCVLFFSKSITMPRTTLAITILAGMLFLCATRASWRLAELIRDIRSRPSEAKRALIIGAGEAGAYIARDLMMRSADVLPLGFIDDDPNKKNKIIAGLPVIGNDHDLPEVARRLDISLALIAIPSADGGSVKKYLDSLADLGIDVRVLPSIRELAGSSVTMASMRPVSLADLLRRDQIKLDENDIDHVISGKTVLVTGAGGSIGIELCEQIARYSPARLVMLGHGEGSIYNALQHMSECCPDANITPIIADIADERTMRGVFETYRPHAVFHAAAHKHVPLMEYNPREALRVNARGTASVARLAGEFGSERFVMISTDKAVRPSSVMGATKRLAERALTLAQSEWPETSYMTVRFGNVLGSRGSVVPLFERQIARGGPITVTHPDMTRYFMLIPEAVSLVIQAASMGRGGELYVLDMGEPVNITEMARTLIRLHGLVPDKDIKIIFTGVRPGEKLTEELFYDSANVHRTSHDKIFSIAVRHSASPELREAVDSLFASDISDEQMKREVIALSMR